MRSGKPMIKMPKTGKLVERNSKNLKAAEKQAAEIAATEAAKKSEVAED